MIVIWLLGGLIVGLIILYLTRPYYQPFTLSAARFFEQINTTQESRRRFDLRSLFLSRPFYLQLTVLSLLLAGLLLVHSRQLTEREGSNLGIWVVLDTSASMSTQQEGDTRMQDAHDEITELMAHLATVPEETAVCHRFSTFDLATSAQPTDLLENQSQRNSLEHRPLGTDLNQIRSLLRQTDTPNSDNCVITHLFVVTDLPPPEWTDDSTSGIEIIWRDIAQEVDNVGIVKAANRNNSGITGGASPIDIELMAYNHAPDSVSVLIEDENGNEVQQERLSWQLPGIQTLTFTPSASGTYQVQLMTEDAYAYDNTLTLTVEAARHLRVDWQLPIAFLPLTGWVEDSQNPDLRIAQFPAPVDTVPTLLVGQNYGLNDHQTEIDFFLEFIPMLADLNFDLAESLQIQGIILPPNSPLHPVLYDDERKVWFAASSNKQTAYIPGPPLLTDPDANLSSFSTTAFFNALRYLLAERATWPLYTLTTPEQPVPEENRVVLHPGEGNTALPPQSKGEIADIQPASSRVAEEPIWPLFVGLAMFVLMLERGLTAYGGSKWR